MKQAMDNIAALYGYCLRKVHSVWQKLSEQGENFTPQEVQAGAATVFLQAVRYIPLEYMQGDNSAVTEEHRAMVDRLVEIYSQALHTSLDRWKKLGPYNMDAVQAGAASIMIQALRVNYPFSDLNTQPNEEEVRVSDGQVNQTGPRTRTG
jgi:hypothetical protein